MSSITQFKIITPFVLASIPFKFCQKRVSGSSGILPQGDTAEDATLQGHAKRKQAKQ